MTAIDEGHGFAKNANADGQLFSTINFLSNYRLAKQ